MKYYTQARLFPTILTSVPLLAVIYLAVHPFYGKLAAVISFLPIATITAFYGAFVFLCVQINRIVSKEVFQKFFFKDELYMPTTTKLLWCNLQYDDIIKQKVHNKILALYQITVATKADEQANEMAARKTIVMAVSQIRNSLRENRILLQHNIEYGFFRNLLGGALLAVATSIALLIYGYIVNYQPLVKIAWVMIVIYIFPLVFSKPVIDRLGNYYTKILIEQFLGHQ